MRLLRKLKWLTILPAILVVSCAAAWIPPNSWTLRSDGRVRASQRKEDFSVIEFIEKVKKEENKEYALVLTPGGEEEISAHIRQLNAQITQLKNDLQNCRYGK